VANHRPADMLATKVQVAVKGSKTSALRRTVDTTFLELGEPRSPQTGAR